MVYFAVTDVLYVPMHKDSNQQIKEKKDQADDSLLGQRLINWLILYSPKAALLMGLVLAFSLAP